MFLITTIPVLLLTGQVQNKDRVGNKGVRQLGFQEIDTVSLGPILTGIGDTVGLTGAGTTPEPASIFPPHERFLLCTRLALEISYQQPS